MTLHRLCFSVAVFIFFILTVTGYPAFAEPVSQESTAGQSDKTILNSIRFKGPITFCGNRVPIEQQQVRERLEKEMLLAAWNRPQVVLWLKRGARYFPHIETILKSYGLPEDLKYIPVIESALRPHPSSSKGAVGFWQFLRRTGKRYGLRIDTHVDERRNIFASTHAACKYLKDLNKRFDSYLLAISAYNMGEYALKKEISAQKNNDFFSLYLPLQTQRYAFKIIAAKMIFENQPRYGYYLDKKDLYPKFTFDRVNLDSGYQLPLTLIAESAGVPFKTIKDYNPELRGYYLDRGRYTILIPKGHAKGFKKKFDRAYAEWKKNNTRRIHIVKPGDSLIGIAHKYRMSLSRLLKLNNLSQKRVIHPGDRLIVD